jgi:hypothetical protein
MEYKLHQKTEKMRKYSPVPRFYIKDPKGEKKAIGSLALTKARSTTFLIRDRDETTCRQEEVRRCRGLEKRPPLGG